MDKFTLRFDEDALELALADAVAETLSIPDDVASSMFALVDAETASEEAKAAPFDPAEALGLRDTLGALSDALASVRDAVAKLRSLSAATREALEPATDSVRLVAAVIPAL